MRLWLALLLAGLASQSYAFEAGFPGRMGPIAAGYSVQNTETTAILNAMSAKPSPTYKRAMDTLITSLKSNNSWYKMKGLWVLAAPNEQAASLNWINPASNTITVSGTPVFTANQGYMFANLNNLNTNFNPTTASIAQNSENLSVWVLNNVAANTYALGTSSTAVQPRRSSGNNVLALSQNNTTTTGVSGTMTTSIGLTAVNRTVSATFDIFKNGAMYETLTRASVGVDNDFLYIGGKNSGTGALNSGGTHQIAIVSMGAAEVSSEIVGKFNAENTFLSTIGAQ